MKHRDSVEEQSTDWGVFVHQRERWSHLPIDGISEFHFTKRGETKTVLNQSQNRISVWLINSYAIYNLPTMM